MCGIIGSLGLATDRKPDKDLLSRMLAIIKHRGPDACGLYTDDRVGLGSDRLSIIGLNDGNQPLHNETKDIWLVCNGEVFNYVELRQELVERGHKFATTSDSEVIVHLYEERGERCVESLIGQFAIAIWDRRAGKLVLSRDRLGVRPLFYTQVDGTLLFASEIKALFAHRGMLRKLDLHTLDEVLTFWSPLPGHTAFEGIKQLEPGHTLVAEGTDVRIKRYWALSFSENALNDARTETDCIEEFRARLNDAVQIRLRADVPVGAYLSGGLDSSIIAALVQHTSADRLRTFSITFANSAFDESAYQNQMARHLGVKHETIFCHDCEIGEVFPEVIWHSETPLLRTAPAPMFLLSKHVRERGFKVVLTGEGADEFLAGYEIFQEDKIRRFWARDPDSRFRPALLRVPYHYVQGLKTEQLEYLKAFYKQRLNDIDDKCYSHLIRWNNSARLKRMLSDDVLQTLQTYSSKQAFETTLDGQFGAWHPLGRAQYIEAKLFLPEYLLSSQGDRVAMAHAVEGRFPFLDHRLVEFCNALPAHMRLRGLNGKHILKQAARDLVPAEILRRPKQPYRAPISTAFFGPNAPEYVAELLSPRAISQAGYFKPGPVNKLVEKARRGGPLGEIDSMAIAGVLSTQILHWNFIERRDARFEPPAPKLDIDIEMPAISA
jgi:asparagine synthase (glutamine-hydrolysing)